MSLTLNDIAPVLKEQYLPGVEAAIEAEGTYTNLIKSRGQKVSNVSYEFTKTFQLGFSEGGGMRAYDAPLPTAGKTKWARFTGTCKHYYHVIKLHKGIISLMRTDKQAFVDAISAEMNGAADAIKCNTERMNFGDAGYSPIAIVSAASNPSGSLIQCTVNDTRFLRPGMPIDFKEANGTAITNGSNLLIDSVDVDNNYVYVLATVTGTDLTTLVAAVADAYIYHEGGYQAEFNGNGSLFRKMNNTVLGIDRSVITNAWFRPHVWRKKAGAPGIEVGEPTGTPQDWEIADIRKPIRDLQTRFGADKAGLLALATEELTEYYARLWAAEGGYHEQRPKVDGWPYDTYSISGVPLLTPLYGPKNGIDIVYMPDIVTFENQPLEWEDMDGGMWKWVAGYDAYTAYMSYRKEMGHYSPWKCAHIGDLKNSENV